LIGFGVPEQSIEVLPPSRHTAAESDNFRYWLGSLAGS
jgi:hypothetical protein